MELSGQRHNLQVTQINISINWDPVLREEKVAWFHSINFLQIDLLLVCFSMDRPLIASLLEDALMSQCKARCPHFAGLALAKAEEESLFHHWDTDISWHFSVCTRQWPAETSAPGSLSASFCPWILCNDRWMGAASDTSTQCSLSRCHASLHWPLSSKECSMLCWTLFTFFFFFFNFCSSTIKNIDGLLPQHFPRGNLKPIWGKTGNICWYMLHKLGPCAAKDDAHGSWRPPCPLFMPPPVTGTWQRKRLWPSLPFSSSVCLLIRRSGGRQRSKALGREIGIKADRRAVFIMFHSLEQQGLGYTHESSCTGEKGCVG